MLANMYFEKICLPQMEYVEDFIDLLIDAELNDLPVLKRACERYLCGELNTVSTVHYGIPGKYRQSFLPISEERPAHFSATRSSLHLDRFQSERDEIDDSFRAEHSQSNGGNQETRRTDGR